MRSYLSTPPSAAKGPPSSPYSPGATTRAAFASLPSAVMRPKLSCPISHNLSRSCNARTSLCSVDISKHWTKRRLLQVACWQNPTAIPPFLVNEDRDLRHVRQSSPSHKLHESQFRQMSTNNLSYMLSCLCNPSIRRQRPSSAARTRPARAATRAAFASLPSAGLRPKFLTQSHT